LDGKELLTPSLTRIQEDEPRGKWGKWGENEDKREIRGQEIRGHSLLEIKENGVSSFF
jgi:hypothetical protein